jgi:hypothetical protein
VEWRPATADACTAEADRGTEAGSAGFTAQANCIAVTGGLAARAVTERRARVAAVLAIAAVVVLLAWRW